MKAIDHSICRCCKGNAKKIFIGNLIGHKVTYFECLDCGYVQTEAPFWLEEAYLNAINKSDTGIMMRNQKNAQIVNLTMLILGSKDGEVVDCAGGYGILVRMLRDSGIKAFWSDKYCQNLLANGFEHKGEEAQLVTAFEAFEHFINPADELDKLLSIAPNILLSTQIIADPAPNFNEWWYYGKNHGQHIGFFRTHTLKKLAESRGKNLITDGKNYHLITDKGVNENFWRLIVRASKLSMLITHKSLTQADYSFLLKNEEVS